MLSHIKLAQKILATDNDFIETPLVKSKLISNITRGEVYCKREDLQKVGSFKIRGATFKISRLSEPQRKGGLLCASAGNHAIAVALTAKKYECKATIVVPLSTATIKIEKIRKFGGKNVEIIKYGKDYGETEKYARKLEEETGKTFISPYNDYDVICGQGTIGLEILKQLPSVDFVVVPFGGGGLICGIAVAMKESGSNTKVIAVQPEVFPLYPEALKAGRIVSLPYRDSLADGLVGDIEEDSITFEIARRYVDDCILVSEEEIVHAIRLFYEEFGEAIEGSGACSLAAILKNKERFEGKKVVAIVSGGNIDKELFQKIMEK